MGKERMKSTVAGMLAGINMMIPTGGLATSKEVTPEDIKPTTSVSDVLIEENKSSELEKLEEMEVNQRFAQFLNGEGEYSDEELKNKLFYTHDTDSDLGFSTAGIGDTIFFQSILLYHKNVGGEEILALGLKDRQRKRVITLVSLPVVDMINMDFWVNFGKKLRNYSNTESKRYYNEVELNLALNEHVGSLLCLRLVMEPDKWDPNFPNQEFGEAYMSLFANKGDINRDFFAAIWRPSAKDIKDSMNRDMIKKFDGKGFMREIDNYSDFSALANDGDILPYINDLYYPWIK